MKNNFFKFLFLGGIIAFMCTLSACKKDADTMASITVIDVNGDVVKDARVKLHQDGQISQAGLLQLFLMNNGQMQAEKQSIYLNMKQF